MATLQDALTNVRCLETLELPDEQPTIEAEPASVVYEVSFDTNFADRTAFITGIGRYNEEATICSKLNVILEQGETYAGLLYTWRSLSRAVPAIKKHEQSNRMEIYEKTVQVLGPEVTKAKELMRFVHSASSKFCEEVRTLAHPEKKKDFISETYLLTLAKLINMFATLDALKNMKACINNDLACYKRAEGILNRGNVDAFALEESQNLSIFFATNNSITLHLKKNLEEVANYEEILVETINLCCEYYENNMFMVPNEKYMLLKAMGYGLVLLDGNIVNMNRMKKSLALSRIDRLFKHLPVATLYGDVQIRFADWIRQLPHYDPSKWTCTSEQAEEKVTVTIQSRVETIRTEHVRFISELARYSNEIITSSSFSYTDQTAKELTDMALQGIKLLTSWTTAVMELYSWKLLHPTNEYDNKDCPKDAEAYERATRYNYSGEEKFALVEVIGAIKSLSLLMHRMESYFSQGIRRHIFYLVQEFAQVTTRDSIRVAVKKKKLHTKTVLLAIRDVCVYWLDGKERTDDPALRGEKDPKMGYHVEIPPKCIGLSSTQLYMMRTMLESLLSVKGGRKPLRADLKESSIPHFESFHRASFFFSHLLNFSSTLRECCDLSQLWFREFYLELTMGSRIQFPIEMSLPWILTDHILQTKAPHMMEYILYPMDLYSDSAHYALHHFKKQFLFDEVEAEVNLCFDQLVYKLSEQIFQYYKNLASCIMLDKRFRAETGARFPHPVPNRYETILKQRHVQLLGRSIDLNYLLAQRLRSNMLKAIDVAIQKFEASDLCSVVELEFLLEINKLTHQLLSKFVQLDSYEVMFREANQSVSSPHGRITLHIFWELHYDFLPNFCFNSTTERFTRAELSFADITEREAPPKGGSITNILWGSKALKEAYTSILKLYEKFVGPYHFGVMCRLLGYQGIAMIMEQLLCILEGQINNTVKQYISALKNGMPQKCKLPMYEYGSKGVLEFYHAQLLPVFTYRDLRSEVFQALKEVGNTILFCLLLEKALGQEEVMDLLQAAPFQNMYPRPYIKEEQSAEVVMQQMDQQYAPLHLVTMVTKFGTQEQASNAKDSDLLTKERLCRALSMFEVIMQKIKGFLMKDQEEWMGAPATNGVMSVEECQEFHRMWSAIQFAYCMPLSRGEVYIDEWCGEGLAWAGCTLLTVLGQQQRFEALDFCYHLLKVNEIDKQDAEVQGVNLKRMVTRIRAYKELNNQIFGILNKHLKHSDVLMKTPREFNPPIYHSTPS